METIYPVNLHEYMQLIRDKKIYRVNQTPFLEHIGLYVNDLKVYRIVLLAFHETLNKSKKVGIHSWLSIITENLPQNLTISPAEIPISKGMYVLYYSYKTKEIKIYAGDR